MYILPVIYDQTHLTHMRCTHITVLALYLKLLYLRCCGIVDLRCGRCGTYVEIRPLSPWH